VGDNPGLDRSLSTVVEPENLAATAMYQLPFGRLHMGGDNFFLRSIASDWGPSGVVTY